MDIETLAPIESQIRVCRDLVEKVTGSECFILLSGDSGSGRTVVCEHAVNETDSRLRAVFIPCNKDMQLQRLRELFLQQLLPGVPSDPDLNLADAIARNHIPHNHKVLVVVDDIDQVSSAFYNELMMLHETTLGQERFAFIAVCGPLWAEERIQTHHGRGNLVQMQLPALSMKEAQELARHFFAQQNAMRVYNAVSGRLAEALLPAKGNIGKIITITEKLMKEPATTGYTTAGGAKSAAPASAKGKARKGSPVGIFVSVVCIIIVLACLVPIMFGSSLFSSSEDQNLGKVESLPVNAAGGVAPAKDYADDDGVLPQRVPDDGLNVASEKKTEHSVTLSGEELDKIEGGAQSSEYPRGVDGSVNRRQPVKTESEYRRITRDDNLNHLSDGKAPTFTAIDVPPQAPVPVAPPEPKLNPAPSVPSFANPDAVKAAQQQQAAADRITSDKRKELESAAKAKLDADRKAASGAVAQKAEEKKSESAPAAPARPALKAGQIINLADEQKALRAQSSQSASRAPAGNAVEGSAGELKSANGKHFTVQIVSASNRANISAAAKHLAGGKYWIVETQRSGRPWYVLFAGEYATRAEAAAAAAAVPHAVSQGAKPFVKQISELKADL